LARNHENYLKYQRQYREKHRLDYKKYMHDYSPKYYSDPKNRERRARVSKEHFFRLKSFFCEMLDNKCERCGCNVIPEENLCIFEFHHVDPKKKERDGEWKQRPSKFYVMIVNGEIDLLCANCHKIVTWKEKEN
jgi:hypothetical protein